MRRLSLTGACVAVVGLGAFTQACSSSSNTTKTDDLLLASESATFENVTRLGPHRFEATLQRETINIGQNTVEKVSVSWADWDNFQLERFRNDRLRAENRVVRGKAFARSGKGRFREAKDAELYRVEMRHSASFWGRALEPFRGRVDAEKEESATINGRPAQRYSISLAPGAPPDRGHVPIALSGEMWLDEATATRLSGHLEGHYLKNGKEEQDVLISLDMSRSEIGIIPRIQRPSGARKTRF